MSAFQQMADSSQRTKKKSKVLNDGIKEESDGTQLEWGKGTEGIKDTVIYLRGLSEIFDRLVTRLENNTTKKITIRLFGKDDESNKGDNKARGGMYDHKKRHIVNKADADEEQIIEEFFHAYQYEFYGAAIWTRSELAHVLAAEAEEYGEEDSDNYALTETLNTRTFGNGDKKLFIENEAKLFVYLVLNDQGRDKKKNHASGLPLKEAWEADASNSGRAMKNGLHERLQREWGQEPNYRAFIDSDNNQQISKDYFDEYQRQSKAQMNYMKYDSEDYWESPHALNSILYEPTEEDEKGKEGYDVLLNGTSGEYYRRYIMRNPE